MSRKLILILCLATLAILVFLVSCSLPQVTEPSTSGEAATEAAAETTGDTVTEAGAEEIPVFAAEAGDEMAWWDGSTFVYVPAGEYQMGDAEATEGDNLPAHAVSLDGFWIHQAEVTNHMYAQCVALGICQAPSLTGSTVDHYNNPDFANHPVVNVDWEDARTYCEWVGGALPSEAQWEWAARGETGTPYYPWGDEAPNCSRLNYADCYTPNFTTPANNYPLGLSPYYLADMAGNVFEWVNDWYAETYYANSPAGNPTGPDTGTERVVRSSSFRSPLEDLPAIERFSGIPTETRDDLGFRCILTGETLAVQPAPVCTALAYVPIPGTVPPDMEGTLPPAFSLDVYCVLGRGDEQRGTAQVLFESWVDVGSVTLSSPNGTLNCNQDQNNPLLFTCTGSALHPGDLVTIDACSSDMPPFFGEPTCPLYYNMNLETDMCEYGREMPAMACFEASVEVFGYGCLPIPLYGDCPAGFYLGTYGDQPVCIPASGPQCDEEGNCPFAACPPGMTFDEGNLCCAYPPDVVPACPGGTTYDNMADYCMPDNPQQYACTSITAVVPTCAPDDEPGTPGCWVRTRTGALVCSVPCSDPNDNEGPCTP